MIVGEPEMRVLAFVELDFDLGKRCLDTLVDLQMRCLDSDATPCVQPGAYSFVGVQTLGAKSVGVQTLGAKSVGAEDAVTEDAVINVIPNVPRYNRYSILTHYRFAVYVNVTKNQVVQVNIIHVVNDDVFFIHYHHFLFCSGLIVYLRRLVELLTRLDRLTRLTRLDFPPLPGLVARPFVPLNLR